MHGKAASGARCSLARPVVALSETHWLSGEPRVMGDEAPTLRERQGPFPRGS